MCGNNYGVHPSETAIKGSGSSRGLFLKSSASSRKIGPESLPDFAHAQSASAAKAAFNDELEVRDLLYAGLAWAPGTRVQGPRSQGPVGANDEVLESVAPTSSSAISLDTIPEGRRLTTYWPPNRGFSGTPVRETLKPGTRIDRYGYDGGTFVSPEGVPSPMRSLAPGTTDKPYSIFDVVKPLDVQSGKTAPWFGQPGGGTQFELDKSVRELLEEGVIRRVAS